MPRTALCRPAIAKADLSGRRTSHARSPRPVPAERENIAGQVALRSWVSVDDAQGRRTLRTGELWV
jgi:hypothetical protein